MSVICITGVPGSGKSYFAASQIKEIYDKKNRLIFTNLNLKVSYDDYLKPLKIDDLYKFAREEYKLFEQFKRLSKPYEEDDFIALKDDEDVKLSNNADPFLKYLGNYDKYLKDSGLLDKYGGSYIVWDECQNDLQDNDPVWVRFFSYHRHFGIDVVLITQDVGLLHRKYKPFIAKFYFGQNAAKRLFSKTLRFKVYTDSRQFEKFYIETISLNMIKEIWDFYDSGHYEVEKSVILKKLGLPLLLIAAAFLLYRFFFSGSSDESAESSLPPSPAVESSKSVSNHRESSRVDDVDEIPFEDSRFLVFTCNLDICYMREAAFTVPFDVFNKFVTSLGGRVLYVSKITNYLSSVSIVLPRVVAD